MEQRHIRKVRRLDVAWAHKFNEAAFGHPFLPGPSEVTGKWYSADENALICMHKLRTKVGTKAQAKQSRAWLRSEGLLGLWEQPLADN